MWTKLILSLTVVALVHGQVSAVSYDQAIQTVDEFLVKRADGEDLYDNIMSIKMFFYENRKNYPSFKDRATDEIFHLIKDLGIGAYYLCSNRSSDSIKRLDMILGHKTCKPTMEGGNRLERMVHLTCKHWARECANELSAYLEDELEGLPNKPNELFRGFLQDANSRVFNTYDAKMQQVENNLKGPEAGRVLVEMISSQKDKPDKPKAMQEIDKNLDNHFKRYVIRPCKEFEAETARTLDSVDLGLQTFEPNEIPSDDDSLYLYDGLSLRHVCHTVTAKKQEYMEKIHQYIAASLAQ